ncbi:class I SAM-dependent methyltransferase [Coleofasciculus sp.]|uniref:class I SAM-dependent methyltransferase n=1 Tax=Coleofasciculus sp. TaxID=3100458 RepID=UPI0039FB0046
MKEENQLMLSVRNRQKDIEEFVYLKLLPKVFQEDIRKTRHFREWFRVPMNYPRIIELPLTIELLDLNPNNSILDISSPKLLSLYLAERGYNQITISDIEDYFMEDFKKYSKAFNISPKIDVFDATNIPYKNNTFDKVFSVSVLEHIPDFGDVEVVREVLRVLKPGGCFVFTLPAYHAYLEEWLKKPTFYWASKKNQEGDTFYQRRYHYLTRNPEDKNIRQVAIKLFRAV